MKILHLFHDLMNLYGEYANTLALQKSLSEKISVMPDIDKAVEEIAAKKHAKLYTVTCFSDKAKFLSKVKLK